MVIEVRRCRAKDIRAMRGKLRAEDVIEIRRRNGREPYAVLIDSFRRSEVAYVGLIDGEIACAWGVARESILSSAGVIWLLSTAVMERAPVAVARRTRRELQELLKVYPELGNYVDSEYEKCVRWLEWLGFTLEPPEPLGIRGGMFRKFYITRGECPGIIDKTRRERPIRMHSSGTGGDYV